MKRPKIGDLFVEPNGRGYRCSSVEPLWLDSVDANPDGSFCRIFPRHWLILAALVDAGEMFRAECRVDRF